MFVYSIKDSWLTKYDPYWICRLLALKASTAAIILCLWNAFFFSPSDPGLYFMAILIGVMSPEMLPAYSKKQQLLIFWKLVLIIAFTTILFGFISYFKVLTLIAITALTYLYFRFLATNTQTAFIPAILVMFGIVGVESGDTDFNAAANSLLFYIELGLVGSVTVLFFPNFRDKLFKSAFLRLLQTNTALIDTAAFTNNDQRILNDLSFMKAQLPRLNQAYADLYANILSYQITLSRQKSTSLTPSSPLVAVLPALFTAVSAEERLSTLAFTLPIESGADEKSMLCISNLVKGWNQSCKA